MTASSSPTNTPNPQQTNLDSPMTPTSPDSPTSMASPDRANLSNTKEGNHLSEEVAMEDAGGADADELHEEMQRMRDQRESENLGAIFDAVDDTEAAAAEDPNDEGATISHEQEPQQQGDEEDEVVMEYEVYLTHSLERNLYLMQYPLRPKDRPYDPKSMKKMTIKPKHQIVTMEFGLNQQTPDYDTESDFRDKVTHSLKAAPVPIKTNYSVGVLRGTSLFITPLRNIIKFLPDMQYLNEHFDNDVRMIDEEEDEEQSSSGKKKKSGKKKSSASTATIVQNIQTRRELAQLQKSYSHLRQQEEAEEAVPLQYFNKTSRNSSDLFERLLVAPFNEVTFDMNPEEYIDTLVPYKEDPLAQFNKKVISLDLLKRVKQPNQQLVYIMKGAKILTLDRICELATRTKSEDHVLQILPSLAYFIRGRWIGNAATVSEPGLYERWSYLLTLFRKEGRVQRLHFTKTSGLSQEKALELLESIAVLDRSDHHWYLKYEEDMQLPLNHPELMDEQKKQLDALEKDVQHHLDTKFAKVSTKAKDSQALAASVVTHSDLQKKTLVFLVNLVRRYGVVSPSLMRTCLIDIQSKKEEYKKITIERVKECLKQVYVKFNGVFAGKKSFDRSSPEILDARMVFLRLMDQKKKMTREEITTAMREKLGKDIPTNLFYKFTEELCRKPTGPKKLYVAKDGTEPLKEAEARKKAAAKKKR